MNEHCPQCVPLFGGSTVIVEERLGTGACTTGVLLSPKTSHYHQHLVRNNAGKCVTAAFSVSFSSCVKLIDGIIKALDIFYSGVIMFAFECHVFAYCMVL